MKNKNKNSQQNKQKNIQNCDTNEIKLLNKKVKRENVPINKEEKEKVNQSLSKNQDILNQMEESFLSFLVSVIVPLFLSLFLFILLLFNFSISLFFF